MPDSTADNTADVGTPNEVKLGEEEKQASDPKPKGKKKKKAGATSGHGMTLRERMRAHQAAT